MQALFRTVLLCIITAGVWRLVFGMVSAADKAHRIKRAKRKK